MNGPRASCPWTREGGVTMPRAMRTKVLPCAAALPSLLHATPSAPRRIVEGERCYRFNLSLCSTPCLQSAPLSLLLSLAVCLLPLPLPPRSSILRLPSSIPHDARALMIARARALIICPQHVQGRGGPWGRLRVRAGTRGWPAAPRASPLDSSTRPSQRLYGAGSSLPDGRV